MAGIGQVSQRGKLRVKLSGAAGTKITVHLLNLLFVTAVGISLLRQALRLSPNFTLQQAQQSTWCEEQPQNTGVGSTPERSGGGGTDGSNTRSSPGRPAGPDDTRSIRGSSRVSLLTIKCSASLSASGRAKGERRGGKKQKKKPIQSLSCK